MSLFDYCHARGVHYPIPAFLYICFCIAITYSFSNYGEKFREVATLSRLQHQHVVRYYQVQTLLFYPQICLLLKRFMFFVSDFRVCFPLKTFPFVSALIVFSIKLTIHPGLLDRTFSKYRLIIFQEGHSF